MWNIIKEKNNFSIKKIKIYQTLNLKPQMEKKEEEEEVTN